MEYIETVEQLEMLYGTPVPTSLAKVADHLTPEYRRWIEASKFCVLSTVGPDGTDGTPRGDDGPVVVVQDAKTILMPDWAGNNRNDSLRNILRDDRMSLMFFVRGSNSVVRVNGHGKLTADAGLCGRFARKAMVPKTVLVMTLSEVYFQCAKAVMRAQLWGEKNEKSDLPDGLPTAGDFLRAMTKGAEGGADYDAVYEECARQQFWVRDDT